MWISNFGRKIRLNFSEDLSFIFFGGHLFLGGKTVLYFRFWPKNPSQFRVSRVNLIQEQWQFGSRSLTVVSLFQKSPPPFLNPGYASE